MPTLIVFCHLRWDFVFQRPQHLMTRLAEHYQILIVEEPIYTEGPAHLKKTAVAPNITVCQPHTAIHAGGFHDDQIPTLQTLLTDLVPDGEQPVVWFYTPMALPLLQGLHASLVVYDCMDELAAFKNSPKQLLQRETALLNTADLVFTGGPSLYEAKRDRHPNAHCFSSSVDASHFRQALDRASAHEDQAAIPGPRLGFYGVIDERFDAELVKAMAAAHPEWQIVLVGPVVKIDPATLPDAPNVHYMGQRTYAELPRFLAGWDVCLLPFALNDSTKFISPTKVLEYMAAELPCVSTPITDVKVPYGDIVAIADTPETFIAACERMLAASAGQKVAMAARMREIVAGTSWNLTARRMHQLIGATTPGTKAARAIPAAAAEPGGGASVNALPVQGAQKSYKAIIIGSGPTGLSAAYHLGADTLVLERNPTIDGWCRSINDAGFTFDFAGDKGGFQALMDGFKPHIKGKIELNADVVQVLPKEHVVALADGRRFRYADLVSTMPLPELIRAMGDEAPAEVRAAAKGLRHVSIRCVNIGIDRVATDKHWIYYPEDTIFHRIFVQGNAAPDCNPPGGFGFTCEISYSPYKPLPVDGEALIARAIADCRKVGLIQEGDKILCANQVDMPIAYVLYDHNRSQNVEICKAWLKQHDITLAGRYSEWEYYNSDHALLAGKKAADAIRVDAAPMAATAAQAKAE